MRVRDAMTHHPVACDPETTLRTAARIMAERAIRAVPVVHQGHVVGIITDRDIACRGVAFADDAPRITVARCMSAPVIAVHPDDPLEHAVTLMQENAIQHVPVIGENGVLVGILAHSDLGRRMTNREYGAFARMTSAHSRYARGLVAALVKLEH